MEEGLNNKKPNWVKESPTVDFKLMNQPLEQVYNRILSNLEKEERKPNNFYFLLKSFTTTTFQTYKSIRKLVINEPKYSAQAHILGRSLIDILCSVVAMTENPEDNSIKYEKAGYRIQWEQFKQEEIRYGQDGNWRSWLKNREDYLRSYAKSLNLSENEENAPKETIGYWPNPFQMIAKTNKSLIKLSEDRKNFLEEIITWRYAELSEWSHIGWGGLAINIFATMPQLHWQPGKLESDAVYTGLLLSLMIISEIELHCNYGETQNLRYIWTILNNYFEEAKDYYNLRYNNLLCVK